MPKPAQSKPARAEIGKVLEILEFRAENFQQLLAPPPRGEGRKEFDFFFEPL